VTNRYIAGFDAGWEIDIFGGVRRGIEAAEAELQFSIEDRRDVLVTLSAEVAANYVALRGFQQRTAIARRNLDAQRRTAEITHKRQAIGLVGGLDAANADAQVATTSSAIPLLESAERQAIYALSVLLDRAPAELVRELEPIGEIPSASPAVPVGVPGDLLRRRPDIRRSEADIHAATARIGIAEADLYPRVTIFGSVGYQAGNLSSLTNPASAFWSFGPNVSWAVFNTGRNLANIEIQRALTEQTILIYRRTILTAVQEVENALVASQKEQQRRVALAAAVAANRKAVQYATDLYRQGETDFLNVLNAQRSLFATEEALSDSERDLSTQLIALYKAIGGGWEKEKEEEVDHRGTESQR
jgi:NodT family efflux transporter outer membrane factor (OMF) lipoprotein